MVLYWLVFGMTGKLLGDANWSKTLDPFIYLFQVCCLLFGGLMETGGVICATPIRKSEDYVA